MPSITLPVALATTAAAGVGGALISSGAAKSAAASQATAATQAAQVQLETAKLAAQTQLGMFNTIRGDLTPYRDVGSAALPSYRALLGLPGGAAPAPTTQVGSTVLPPSQTGGINLPGGGSDTITLSRQPDGSYALALPGGASAAPGGQSLVPTGASYRGPNGEILNPALTAGGLAGGAGTMGGVAGAAAPPMKAGDTNLAQVLKDRPDVLAEYNRILPTVDWNSPWAAQHGFVQGGSPEDFANWWLQNKPTTDTYAAPTWTQEDIDKLYPPATGSSGSTPPATTPAVPANGPSLTGGAGTGTGDIQAFLENLPGYKFVRDQGIQAVTNKLGAAGLAGNAKNLSGAYGKGIARFVTGLADTTYGDQVARLAGAVTTGQSAATQTGTFGSQAASGAAGNLTAGGTAVAGGITGAANAGAAGTIAAANAASGGLNSVANSFLTSQILKAPQAGMYAPQTVV